MTPPMHPPRTTILAHALHHGSALVIGGGLQGTLTVYQLHKAAKEEGLPLQIYWAFDDQRKSASANAGAYHAVFASTDSRAGLWAERSWEIGPAIFADLGVDHLVHDIPTLYVSNLKTLRLPPGLPSEPKIVDPATFGLEQSYFQAALVEAGRVFSPRELLPAMTRAVRALPGVITSENKHFQDVEDIRSFCEELEISTAFVCAGAGVSRLLNHVEPEVMGSLGVLIHLKMREAFGFHNSMVVMDEDDDGALTYSIPAPATGTIGVGGTVDKVFEYPYSSGAPDVEDHRQQKAEIARDAKLEFEGIRKRAISLFPRLEEALRFVGYEDSATFALRPHASGVILRVLPSDLTGEVAVAEISGLGGSGYTIAPAVTEDALKLEVPQRATETEAAI
ncbi:FAD-dependent oxidoreductase [Sinomonas humi]|uniref:FAD dependent oxidoreductase domain-containing protein n=1 Tax=Sinomonas humi TaxID=1338436 RepID=A0A0B2AEH7_9MICC|nr:FAD-dependent oxidoreductase [Sinomonas humi]KHL00233.1 hypothetical protein LK10_20695 [Sinomonas humi]